MYDNRLADAETELQRAKEINPTGSDLLFEIEGTLRFWKGEFAESKRIFTRIRIPSPISSVFIAASEFYLDDKESAAQRVQKIENDFAISIQRLFAGESYRSDEMRAKIAPLFPIRQVA
jgi:hypothetical protein